MLCIILYVNVKAIYLLNFAIELVLMSSNLFRA